MANLKGTSGQLEWVDVNAMDSEAEHFMCSDIDRDPTGRLSLPGLALAAPDGERLQRVTRRAAAQAPAAGQVLPAALAAAAALLLTVAQEKDVRKNLRTFSAKAEDAMARSGMQGEAKIICQQKSAAFEEWLKLKDDEYKAQRQTRIDMRGGLESDNESAYTLVEDVDEEEISYKEECVDRGGPRDSD